MPIAHEFDYVKPASLEEAVAILAERPGAQVLAGGTDLVGWLRDEFVEPSVLVDIKGLDGLHGIEFADGILSIGSLTTFTELIESETVRSHAPLLYEMGRTVASTGIRNRATVVGNICSAVPCCDAGPVLLVYDAIVHATGIAGARTIPIREWFVGNKRTVLPPDEIVTGVTIRLPMCGHGAAYVKLGRYRGEDLAQASVAVVSLPGNAYRIAFGAVAATPVRAQRIEAVLEGRELDQSAVDAAKGLVPEETSPITDVRASQEYRELMLPIMLERGLRAAVARRDGEGPEYGTRFI
jgi:carbon-monoxide dehydrogenase medium subunit